MVNPFKNSVVTQAQLAKQAQQVAQQAGQTVTQTPPAAIDPKQIVNQVQFATTKSLKPWRRFEIHDARNAVRGSYVSLQTAENAVLAHGTTTTLPDALKFDAENAARQFNNDVSRLGYAHGKLGSSVKGMFKSFAETLGVDTSKWASRNIKGTPVEALERAAKIKGNIVERGLSKPFRIAAENPKTAMTAGALAIVAAVGAGLNRRAARRTQENVQNQLMEAQGIAEAQQDVQQYAAAPAQTQVTAEDMARLNARWKGGQSPAGGHAAAIDASRQQQAQQTVAQL